MFKIKKIDNLKELFLFHQNINSPYIFSTDYEKYLFSLCQDTDSYGNVLFDKLKLLGAYQNDSLIGFIQFGTTNFGFDESREISKQVKYNVIRNLYFEDDKVGRELLKSALKELKKEVFAFFHYFGMSCFGRHGKLSSNLKQIENLLFEFGFESNEINIYYSCEFERVDLNSISKKTSRINDWGVQNIVFEDNNEFIGECEIHLVNKNVAYLRWIYVSETKQHLGYGSKCMNKLKSYLLSLGINKLDADTADNNINAQQFYLRNGFVDLGKTKSYLKKS